MKDEHLFYNPFRMLSPKLDHEIEHTDELHEKPVTEEISLEEGLLIMTSKLIEMCRLLSICIVNGSAEQMDRVEVLAKEVHQQEKLLTRDLVKSGVQRDLLKGLIRFPYRLERIGDMLESILNCSRIKAGIDMTSSNESRTEANKWSPAQSYAYSFVGPIPFSDKAYSEMDQLFERMLEMLNNLRDAIRTPNKLILEEITSDGKKMNQMFEDFKLAHWERLEAGYCTVLASSLYRDILDSVKSVNEYLIKMSQTLLELASKTPALREARAGDSESARL
jgi:Na+/phosphate symporter